jgi:hypothetical protein
MSPLTDFHRFRDDGQVSYFARDLWSVSVAHSLVRFQGYCYGIEVRDYSLSAYFLGKLAKIKDYALQPPSCWTNDSHRIQRYG